MDFPNLIDRCKYNRRCKWLYPFLADLNKGLAALLNEGEDTYIVDSVSVCKIANEKQSKVCQGNFETAPDKSYSAVSKAYYWSVFASKATPPK